MRLRVPITGTVISYDPALAKLDGIGISGDPNDPVRLVPVNLGNVSWRLVSIDLDNEVAEIEVTAGEDTLYNTGEVDKNGKPIINSRPATFKEKEAFLKYASNLINNHTKDELYSISKSPRLKKRRGVNR